VKPRVACIQKFNPSVTERAEAEEAIKDFEQLELAQSIIRNRIAYRKAARDGLCVAELRPTDPDRSRTPTANHSLHQEALGQAGA
jgi:cellulose biosynthesis protein BcsQ